MSLSYFSCSHLLPQFCCECRLWKEQVRQFFNLKSEDQSWSLMLELKVLRACMCLQSLINCIALINPVFFFLNPYHPLPFCLFASVLLGLHTSFL